jgi:hypothetical protein
MSERKNSIPGQQHITLPPARWKELAKRLLSAQLCVPDYAFALFIRIDREIPDLTFHEFFLALLVLHRFWQRWDELQEEEREKCSTQQ